MKLIKLIIAVFLLLTYSFAFAVELIPHCHCFNDVTEHIEINQSDSQHEHHNHVQAKVIDGDSIAFKKHSCEDILCIVECFLSELEHPQSDIIHQHFTASEINSTDYKGLSKTKIIAVLFAVFVEPTTIESHQEFNTIFIDENQLSLIKSSPHRGPPSLSC